MAKATELARLIVAPSDTDADMLYATGIFIGDPFIFLELNGRRTLVLSDLEIDRAKKNTQADEFVMLSVPLQRMCAEEEMGGPGCNKEVLAKLNAMKTQNVDSNANALWKGLDKFKDI